MSEHIRTLIDRGYGDQVVVSQDICTKTRLTTYGGHGYGHMFRNVVPLMRHRGLSESEIDTILVHTPRRLLGIDKLAHPRSRRTNLPGPRGSQSR